MAWIKFPPEVQRYHNAEHMPDSYWIEPSENGVAQVKSEVAEQLVEHNLADYHTK